MRVAVVEDEKELARALQKGLGAEAYDVDLFYDATSARSDLMPQGNQYDLIMLDLMLPDGHGADLCREMRAQGVRTPIMVLTALDSIQDKVDLFERGADDFLTKPFSFEELLARSRALTRRASTDMHDETSIDDLRIVAGTRSVYHAGEAVGLTAREFDLLLYLVHNRGKVISREELLSKVWKHKEVAVTNVVDVHVRNLRKKLDDPHEHQHIQTIHGVGYTVA